MASLRDKHCKIAIKKMAVAILRDIIFIEQVFFYYFIIKFHSTCIIYPTKSLKSSFKSFPEIYAVKFSKLHILVPIPPPRSVNLSRAYAKASTLL
jgi:hypothetical protein